MASLDEIVREHSPHWSFDREADRRQRRLNAQLKRAANDSEWLRKFKILTSL